MADIARIEDRIDRVAAGALQVSDQLGGLRFQNMIEVMEFAKMMSIAGLAVPQHLRGEPGTCLAVCVQALEWRFSPFSVANKSYSVNGRIAYESQLIHAVIEARAPLVHRLRCEYEGENDTRVCVVTGHIRGEVDPLIYRSPLLNKITPKNSPLWKSDPDQQLWYYASRSWARRFCPDILLGVFARDELEDSHVGADNAKDVSDKPGVGSRLKGAGKGRGFSASHVERETARGVIDETASSNTEAQREAGSEADSTKTSPPASPASEQGSVSTDSGAAQDRCESAAPPNSPHAPSAPQPPHGTMPAPEDVSPDVSGAGPSSADDGSATKSRAEAEPKQASEPGNTALHGPAGLPPGWERDYAAALARAKKPHDIGKRHTEWFADKGGYVSHKTGPDRETIDAIFKCFQNHFSDHEARDAILHELNAI